MEEKISLILVIPTNISIKRQAELLSMNRTSLYRDPPKEKSISEKDLRIMHKIDELHTAHPTWGYRMLTKMIRRELKVSINRKKVRRMMRDMGVYTIYPKPNLSKRYHARYKRPYLLRNLNISCPDQVWGVDITYIRMKQRIYVPICHN